MSDAVRSYRSGSLPASPPGRPPRFGILKNAAKIVALLFGAMAIYVITTTRDTHPLQEFIAADNAYHVNVYDFINRRTAWSQSPIWDSLSESWVERDIPEQLLDNHSFPDWMVRNFVGRQIHITGNDWTEFSDAVFITRITSVGCLLERGLRWTPRFASDNAGGLRLQYIKDDAVYYAVRGRTLILSANRDAVIAALTLDPGEIIETPPPAYSSNKPLLTARLTPNITEGPLSSFSSLEGSFHHDAQTWNTSVIGTLTEDIEAIWEPLIQPETGKGLYIPVDGAAVLSLNTGSSLEDIWPALGTIIQNDIFTAQHWQAWKQADKTTSYTPILTEITRSMGQRLAVSWNGFDHNAQSPTPNATVILSHDKKTVDTQLGKLSTEPPGEEFQQAYIQNDTESGRVYFFGKGGPSQTPTLQPHNTFSILTTGIPVMKELNASDTDLGSTLQGDDTIYVSFKPEAVTAHIVELGTALADYGMIDDMNADEFSREAARWREKASLLDAISLIGKYDDGKLNVTIQIQTAVP
ncbi:MAG: hypothetical protein COA73_14925 [Candidatus Hydrogenedentota bacterium]|nr:MAG: hypothetical protein COA73_14925 [Candidatus Hydrogenedentota bacterium]